MSVRALFQGAFGYVLACGFLMTQAWAVPGPDSVAILANKDIPESVTLAQDYAKARQIPANQLCALSMPKKDDLTFAEYEASVRKPFEACLQQGGVTSRIEAVAIMRGVPMRVSLPGGRGSLAAVLGMWKSTVQPSNKAVVGLPVGYRSNYFAAGWINAFRSGPFRPGWSGRTSFRYTASGNTTNGTYTHKPLLVTMLHGRNYKDAALLIKSALDAEKQGGAKGQFMLMEGRDKARGVLDREYDSVIAGLKQRGFTDAVREKFQTDLAGRTLAVFITGTATLGKAIEGNTYLPGSLTDNLTSFGAVPRNFQATGQSQVSIARWVAKGVAGAHGTTDEPLNNVFPSRQLVLDYVDGSTLAEAYLRRMPFAYWRNLVLGDPMAAPYAQRPVVKITYANDGETVTGARKATITATDPGKRGIASISLLVDGKVVATSKTSPLEVCVKLPTKADVQILAVAQAAPATGTNRRKYQPKGWQAIGVTGAAGGPTDCAMAEPSPEPQPEPQSEPSTEVPTGTDVPGEGSTMEPSGNEPTADASADAGPSEQPGTADATPDTTATPDSGNGQDATTSPDPAPMTDTPSSGNDNGTTTDNSTSPPKGGCGCQSQPQGPGIWLFLLLFVAVCARRRNANHTSR